jgi:hypothetical protein
MSLRCTTIFSRKRLKTKLARRAPDVGYFGDLAAGAACDKVRRMAHEKKTPSAQAVLRDLDASHHNKALHPDFDQSMHDYAGRRKAGIIDIGTAFAKYINMCGIRDGRSRHED